jgi:hypothetical protein
VGEAIRKLREVHQYQKACILKKETDNATDIEVHRIIAAATIKAHADLEECMDQVIKLEGWDRQTLQMPEGLRRRQLNELMKGDHTYGE